MKKKTYNIIEDNKTALEKEIMEQIIKYEELDFVECIAICAFYDRKDKTPIVGINMICNTKQNRDLLDIETSRYQKQIGNIQIRLISENKSEVLNERQKFFKFEEIVVDKKDYRQLQKDIYNYSIPYDNLFDFEPPLVLTKTNNK